MKIGSGRSCRTPSSSGSIGFHSNSLYRRNIGKMNLLMFFVTLVISLSILHTSSSTSPSFGVMAIYTEIYAGKSVCFAEDITPNTPVIVTYTAPSTVVLSTLTIRDPFGGVVSEEKNFPSNGPHKVQFKTRFDVSGMYEICIMPTQFASIHVYGEPTYAAINIEVDREHTTMDHPESKDRVEKLSNLLTSVQGKINEINAHQNYLKEREARFRFTTDSTYERCFWMGAGKFGLLFVLAAWQLYNLRSFFKKRKLI
ncbi:predicted protein [Naegleria gruberi]|uniref:Predicted protein n=1 Tax=Naegleria gruberi TaxID=5762 RepID=D2VMQ4_NAEGR|nr:uncharacterized protein NAEGRDRAFT_70221 [Naegleria gruberi]EFC41773.1 predicted protein [Naegleria gruberi]|eukprot:XP_002674517.1 predicted protein [Naegleria gruberi strain NEG-M]